MSSCHGPRWNLGGGTYYLTLWLSVTIKGKARHWPWSMVGVSAGLDTRHLLSEALWVQGQRDRYTRATRGVTLLHSPVWVRVSFYAMFA